MRKVKPKISFASIIKLPMHKRLIVEQRKNIYRWENDFSKFKEECTTSYGKKNYDRCRSILKWATTFGASLSNVIAYRNAIEFTLVFDSIDSLIAFNKGLKDFIN